MKIFNRKEKPGNTVLGKPKPLSEILGNDFQKKTYLKNADAHLYFEDADLKVDIQQVIKKAF